MPIPLVIAGISGASALFGATASGLVAGGSKSVGAAYLKRQLSRNSEDIEKWALSAVFEKMGLPDLMDGSLSRASFTDAINASFLSGQDFQLTDIFDSEAVKRDATRYGLKALADQAGIPVKTPTLTGMKDAIREWVMQLVEDELTMGELGELTQDAKEIYDIVQLYRKYKAAETDGEAAESGGRKPLINTPEAASNRARQKKYRDGHKRVWQAK